MNELATIIVKLLLNFGISPNTKGYHYLRDCIYICVTTKEPINALTKMLYAKMAENYHTTECSVERAVRHAIKSGWYRHNTELAEKIFVNVLQGVTDIPTNSVFISTISEWIRVNYADLIKN
ncbi:MAG: sporulation initiation factor Spo0A C-terminal domain-containing protein [Ruminococcus sp.]|uniref:sporulation initiation factor Spo0A C-terminal domain-containing protein n=1 Tax=Ruminococcus sp. TaxID=41978 RepID=UPI0025EEEBFF|nr:sporulation initiation factor Spo0A C-terminal domain-containing protein [Ruminococcus sp.]MBR5682627.1 sporulation initiation factor Spo0A C-terminal domain-containing protein [Ruminococcus sp.]